MDTHMHSGVGRAARALLAGVASVVPVLATAWLLVIIYRILRDLGDGIIAGLFRYLNMMRGVELTSPDAWSFKFPGSDLVLALLPVFILFLIGSAVTNRPGRRLLGWFESKIAKLPLLGFIYSSIKQLMDALKGLGSERRFKGVAYIEYPSPGCRLLGFITGEFHDQQSGKDVTSVFLPTAPNPLTGFVVIVENDRVMRSSMRLEEASKLVLSAGLVSPFSAQEVEGKDAKPRQTSSEITPPNRSDTD